MCFATEINRKSEHIRQLFLVVRASSTCMHSLLSNKRMQCMFNTVKDEWYVVCLWNGLIGFS
jgi:hypothetical protein